MCVVAFVLLESSRLCVWMELPVGSGNSKRDYCSCSRISPSRLFWKCRAPPTSLKQGLPQVAGVPKVPMSCYDISLHRDEQNGFGRLKNSNFQVSQRQRVRTVHHDMGKKHEMNPFMWRRTDGRGGWKIHSSTLVRLLPTWREIFSM